MLLGPYMYIYKPDLHIIIMILLGGREFESYECVRLGMRLDTDKVQLAMLVDFTRVGRT